MLHADVLALLYHFAAYSRGSILEIGPFTGGSTVAMCLGIKEANASPRFVSIEKGGAMDHETHGSRNIISDFHTHVKQYEVEGYSRLVEGYSRDSKVVSTVKAALGYEKLGLLFLDADGLVDRDLQAYANLLQPNTYLVVDDYFSPDEWTKKEKTPFTKQTLDCMQERGEVECFGVYGWGTWVGRIR